MISGRKSGQVLILQAHHHLHISSKWPRVGGTCSLINQNDSSYRCGAHLVGDHSRIRDVEAHIPCRDLDPESDPTAESNQKSKQMETETVLMAHKTQCCENVNSP